MTPERRRRLFWPLLGATFVVNASLAWIGAPLANETAPAGIITYEFVGDVATAERVLDSWSPTVRARAAFSLGLDYLFLVLYSATIAVACLMTGDVLRSRRWPLAPLAPGFAGAQWVAAGADAVENAALLAMLLGAVADPWPRLAWICAALKFTLVAAGVLYSLVGLIARYAVRPS